MKSSNTIILYTALYVLLSVLDRFLRLYIDKGFQNAVHFQGTIPSYYIIMYGLVLFFIMICIEAEIYHLMAEKDSVGEFLGNGVKIIWKSLWLGLVYGFFSCILYIILVYTLKFMIPSDILPFASVKHIARSISALFVVIATMFMTPMMLLEAFDKDRRPLPNEGWVSAGFSVFLLNRKRLMGIYLSGTFVAMIVVLTNITFADNLTLIGYIVKEAASLLLVIFNFCVFLYAMKRTLISMAEKPTE